MANPSTHLGLVRSASTEPRASVLLVDDNPANLLSFRAILEELELNLVDAQSGEDALQRIRSGEFAVVLLDVLLPGLSGFETAKLMRGQGRSKYTPIIFMTANDIERPQLEQAYSLGAVDFLVRPLVPVVLQAKVGGFVELFQDKQRAKHEADQLRLLVQGTTDYAIFMIDPQGYVVTWGPRRHVERRRRAHQAVSGGRNHRPAFLAILSSEGHRPGLACPRTSNRTGRGTYRGRGLSSGRRRILVVDDNLDSAESLGQLLEMLGNEVRTAGDGEAGIQIAELFRPDVILLDIGMPKLNGYEACRRIRDQSWGDKVTLIALTGWGQEEDRRRSQDAGFDHHLVKPVDPVALKKLLGDFQTSTN
jgi:CheY-like chemotaxis protein